MKKFGFYVELTDDFEDPEDAVYTGYEVGLPHQCDSWRITSTDNRSIALQELTRFIKEAQSAYNMLALMPDDIVGKKVKG